MEIRRGSVTFQPLRGDGPRPAEQSLVFPRPVVRAAVGFVGTSFGFSGGDHHVGNVQFRADVTIVGSTVTVSVSYGLRDWSGDWDDDYDGAFDFAVLAELEDPAAPPRRNDMIVTGLELTQAIQFFRSAQHLDAATAEPDNAVPLVAGKQLGVRAYVDYDASASTTPVGVIYGGLRVTHSGGVVDERVPFEYIRAKPESALDRANAMDTLNFLLPAAWCQGEVVLECEIWALADPTVISQTFQKTVRFVDTRPLNVFCVGVHYTGRGLDAPPPVLMDFDFTLSSTEQFYPTGEVALTGYTTLECSAALESDDGCGDGFNGLLDQLEDLRSGSQDVYLALVPESALPPDATERLIGCGRSSGVAAAYNTFGPAVAHEIGHTFNRGHVPCDDSTVCGDPADPDESYPHYGAWPRDSIGEFGFDPGPAHVQHPLVVGDFMSYNFLPWVSPYTYRALLASFATGPALLPRRRPADAGVRDVDDLRPGPHIRLVRRPMVFLRLSIARDRTVTLEPSFVQEACECVNGRGRPTEFSVELCDEAGKPLVCRPLSDTCQHCHAGCWPKSFHPVVPFPAGAKLLVVRAGDEVIYQELIGAAPSVALSGQRAPNGDVSLKWHSAPDAEGVLFLPQWRDAAGIWRGLTPRTTGTSLTIAARGLPRASELAFRVLATRRIATGQAQIALEGRVERRRGQLVIKQMSGVVLKARVLDGAHTSDSGAQIVWSDERGGELGRGRTFDLRHLSKLPAELRVSATETRDRVPAQRLVVARTDDRRLILRHLASDEPTPEPPIPAHHGPRGHRH